MAWTAPMTFTANTALTAAQLNTHLRDNMFEMSTAKATTAGQFFVSEGKNKITTRVPVDAHINTSETTTDGTQYVDLATPGPSVTVTTGTMAWVFWHCESTSSGVGSARGCSYKITGATERDASGIYQIRHDGQDAATQGLSSGQVDLVTTLNPGDNTFTLVYRGGAGTPTTTFRNRRIVVWPL